MFGFSFYSLFCFGYYQFWNSFIKELNVFYFFFSSIHEFSYTQKQSVLFPVDTGCKLNIHKTFKRCLGPLLNVLCTFNLRPVSTGLGPGQDWYFCCLSCYCDLNWSFWLSLEKNSNTFLWIWFNCLKAIGPLQVLFTLTFLEYLLLVAIKSQGAPGTYCIL